MKVFRAEMRERSVRTERKTLVRRLLGRTRRPRNSLLKRLNLLQEVIEELGSLIQRSDARRVGEIVIHSSLRVLEGLLRTIGRVHHRGKFHQKFLKNVVPPSQKKPVHSGAFGMPT